jgi:hypothetical protein
MRIKNIKILADNGLYLELIEYYKRWFIRKEEEGQFLVWMTGNKRFGKYTELVNDKCRKHGFVTQDQAIEEGLSILGIVDGEKVEEE